MLCVNRGTYTLETGGGQCAGSLRKIGSFLLLCESWELSSVYQVWWQAPYPLSHLCSSHKLIFKKG